MARDVHSALVALLGIYLRSKENQTSPETSSEGLLQALKEEGRYLVDAWS